MKLFLYEDKKYYNTFNETALIVFGKIIYFGQKDAYYIVFNSPKLFIEKFFDIERDEERVALGFNRYLIKMRNFKITFHKAFIPITNSRYK
jgi:glucose-6-phosphate isomerase